MFCRSQKYGISDISYESLESSTVGEDVHRNWIDGKGDCGLVTVECGMKLRWESEEWVYGGRL